MPAARTTSTWRCRCRSRTPRSRTSCTGVKLGDEQFALDAQWRERGQLALVGMGVEPGLVRRVRPLRRGPSVLPDRRVGRTRRRQPERRRARLRTDVLDLDHDRGVPEPAGGLGARPRLVHDRAVQRARDVRLPRGHRTGRVRQRRARGGAAHAALDRRRARDVQVRPRRASSSTCSRHCTSSASTTRAPSTSRASRCRRATWSPPACPTPRHSATRCTARPAPAGGCTGTGKDGRPREVYLYHVVDNAWSMARVRLTSRRLADRDAPGGGPGAHRRGDLEGRRRCWARRRSTRCRSWSGWRLRVAVGHAGKASHQLTVVSNGGVAFRRTSGCRAGPSFDHWIGGT